MLKAAHPYRMLKEALRPTLRRAGYQEEAEELVPDDFGSAHLTFGDGASRLRLVWDGRDGWGFVQRETPEGWQDLPTHVTEGDLEGAEVNGGAVEQLRSEVERLLGSP